MISAIGIGSVPVYGPGFGSVRGPSMFCDCLLLSLEIRFCSFNSEDVELLLGSGGNTDVHSTPFEQ